MEKGKKIILKNVFFDYNASTLRPESNTELDNLVTLLNENPSMKIEISGHTDSDGSDDYNQKLSEGRANSVVKYLIGKGIAESRLTYKGYGETQPVASNDTDEGKQENRRVEFKVMEN
jgi:outer membrane protein OmpA-like peptidoglycan-associated protein